MQQAYASMEDAHGSYLELSVQIVDQCVHILAEGVVLLHADEICDEWVGHCGMLALPCCPVGQLGAHGGDGVEPCLQKLWVQAVGNGPASASKRLPLQQGIEQGCRTTLLVPPRVPCITKCRLGS